MRGPAGHFVELQVVAEARRWRAGRGDAIWGGDEDHWDAISNEQEGLLAAPFGAGEKARQPPCGSWLGV